VIRPAVLILALAACGRDKRGSEAQPEPKPVGPGAAAGSAVVPGEPEPEIGIPAPAKLHVAKAGKAIAMTKAFIKRVSPDHWRVMVSDQEGSCKELLSGVTNQQPGATTIVATLRKHVRPDGAEDIAVTDVWATGRAAPSKLEGASAKLSVPADKGAQVEVELATIVDGDLAVDGTFTALGCGDQPAMDAGIPKDKHVSTATVTVANHELEIKSAIAKGDDLVLSTGPLDCSGVEPFAPIIVKRILGRWFIGGTWLAQDVSSDVKELTATLGAQGGSKDGPTIAVTVGGSATIGGYAIALDGTVEAIDCHPPPK
jgi:hypothetical protein